MTKYHEWKRRLWGGEYPIENGPPYRDPATGAPILPGGAQGGPLNGMDDDGPQTGNPVVITFTGTLTANTIVTVLIDDQTASAPAGGRWVGAETPTMASGATAAQVASQIAANFESRSWPGWVSAVAVGDQVTFTPQAAGTATGFALYEGVAGVAAIGNPVPPAAPRVQIDNAADPNILVTFLDGPCTGSIVWGDGTFESFTNQTTLSHVYDANGTFTMVAECDGYAPYSAPVLVQGA